MEFHKLVSQKLQNYGIESEFTVISNMKSKPEFLICVSLFRIEKKYKDDMMYSTQLHRTILSLSKCGFRVYIDDSFHIDQKWQFLYKFMIAHPAVEIIRYNFPQLKDSIFHDNLFGTLVRFIPLFSWEAAQTAENIIIIDADMTEKLTEAAREYAIKLRKKDTVIARAYNMGYSLDEPRLWISELNDRNFPIRVQVAPFGSNIQFPCILFIKFLKCVIDKCPNYTSWVRRVLKTTTKTNNLSRTVVKPETMRRGLFLFGIDELFLNGWMIEHLLKTKVPVVLDFSMAAEMLMYNSFINKLVKDKEYISKYYKFVGGTEKEVDQDLFKFMTGRAATSRYFKKVFKWVATTLPAQQMSSPIAQHFISYVRFLAHLAADTRFITITYSSKKKYKLS